MSDLPIDEANGPIAKQLQCVCHDTLPWLISVSLGSITRYAVFLPHAGLSGAVDRTGCRSYHCSFHTAFSADESLRSCRCDWLISGLSHYHCHCLFRRHGSSWAGRENRLSRLAPSG